MTPRSRQWTGGKHTPLPWKPVPPDQAESPFVLGDAEGGSIASFEPVGPWMSAAEAQANLRLAARAVNNHAALVEALEAAADFIRDEFSLDTMEAHHDGHPIEKPARKVWDQIFAALASASGDAK